MDIVVCNREQVERGLRIGKPFILVSITDPGAPPVDLPLDPLRLAVLRLAFDDARPGDQPPDEEQTLRLMTAKDSRAIWNFVSDLRDVETLIVHCGAGWSRSAAVGAAVAYVFDDEAEKFFRDLSPNEYVFRLMLRTVPSRLRQRGR